jgi:DNA polymerase III epsilon subunit-like protein
MSTPTPEPAAPSPAAPNPAEDAPDAAPVPATGRRQGRTRFVFVDTEATGLDHQRHELTEVAWVVRFEDGREEERQYFPEHTTDGADADALELTHYQDRIAPQERTPADEWLVRFLEDAQDAVLVGAVPDFDARHLERMCRKLGLEPSWDHHLLDVETLALPFIAEGPETPRSLAKTCAALGIPHDKDLAHGALYDAQQAMRVFDHVWRLVTDLRESGGPLPPPVPRDANGRNGKNGNGESDATAAATDAPGATEPGDDPTLSPEVRSERAAHHG